MNKRDFLTAGAAFGATFLPQVVSAAPSGKSTPLRGPALLTISGAIGRANRGALDPALDQLMKKQGVQFSKAHAFDFAGLAAIPAVTIRPTLEYDAKPHALSGPLLLDVVKATGARLIDQSKLLLRAIDGYAVQVPLGDIHQFRFIVATHLDGKPMPLGGLGPLWAVYDADRHPALAAKPLNERFGICPWGLYHIEVQ